ncbi:hypothetical protein DW261_14900 [Fusobacterium varium]|nr:hypothetical protein [Salmonella enterica subsp. enterica]RHG31771.1 hypothetical protein DW261_14900 [Fusobacterium varium]
MRRKCFTYMWGCQCRNVCIWSWKYNRK